MISHQHVQQIAEFPSHFGPGNVSRVLRECVQALVDAALEKRQIFGLLRQGEGKVYISSKSSKFIRVYRVSKSFIFAVNAESQSKSVRLPVVETATDFWSFIEVLFEELRCCENLFSRRAARPGSICSKCTKDKTVSGIKPKLCNKIKVLTKIVFQQKK